MLALAIAGGLLALGLKPSAGSDTFVSRSSASFQATAQDHRDFGGDAVVILIKEPLTDLVQTKDLAMVTFLEACLAGQYVVPSEQLQAFQPAPPGAHAPYGGYASPCGKLMRSRPVQVVYGPGTFLNRAVAAVNLEISALLRGVPIAIRQAGDAAQKLALARGLSRAQADAAAKAAGRSSSSSSSSSSSGWRSTPGSRARRGSTTRVHRRRSCSIGRAARTSRKSRFAYLFPTRARR